SSASGVPRTSRRWLRRRARSTLSRRDKSCQARFSRKIVPGTNFRHSPHRRGFALSFPPAHRRSLVHARGGGGQRPPAGRRGGRTMNSTNETSLPGRAKRVAEIARQHADYADEHCALADLVV